MEENIVSPKTNTSVPPAQVLAQQGKASARAIPARGVSTAEPAANEQGHVEQLEALTEAKNELKGASPDVDTLIPSDPYYMDPLFYEVANYFGLEQQDYDGAKTKLADIVDYIIRDIKSNQPDAVLLKLRELERSIEKPGWDEKRYTNVHKYVRLAAKKTTIEQAMKAFEKEKEEIN